MNQFINVIGHVGKDPEGLRYTSTGREVISINVATNKSWKNAEGEKQEKTTWFSVSAFGASAVFIDNYIKSGDLVLVQGEMDEPYAYLKEGETEPKAVNKLLARNVQILKSKNPRQQEAVSDETAESMGYV